jgi:hypothetical protein
MSPTDFCNCISDMRATKPELSSLAGTMASTTFLVFPRTPLLLGAVPGGEPRYARFVPAPVPVPPAFTGLPDRDTSFERITSRVGSHVAVGVERGIPRGVE